MIGFNIDSEYPWNFLFDILDLSPKKKVSNVFVRWGFRYLVRPTLTDISTCRYLRITSKEHLSLACYLAGLFSRRKFYLIKFIFLDCDSEKRGYYLPETFESFLLGREGKPFGNSNIDKLLKFMKRPKTV